MWLERDSLPKQLVLVPSGNEFSEEFWLNSQNKTLVIVLLQLLQLLPLLLNFFQTPARIL